MNVFFKFYVVLVVLFPLSCFGMDKEKKTDVKLGEYVKCGRNLKVKLLKAKKHDDSDCHEKEIYPIQGGKFLVLEADEMNGFGFSLLKDGKLLPNILFKDKRLFTACVVNGRKVVVEYPLHLSFSFKTTRTFLVFDVSSIVLKEKDSRWDYSKAKSFELLDRRGETFLGMRGSILVPASQEKILSGDQDGVVRAWAIDDTNPGKCLLELKTKRDGKDKVLNKLLNYGEDEIRALCITKDDVVASALIDRYEIYLWKIKDPEFRAYKKLNSLKTNGAQIWSLSSTKGGAVVAGLGDGTVKFFDPEKGTVVNRISVVLGNDVRILSFVKGNQLWTEDKKNGIKVWDIDTCTLLAEEKGRSFEMISCFCPEKEGAVSISFMGGVMLWKIACKFPEFTKKSRFSHCDVIVFCK